MNREKYEEKKTQKYHELNTITIFLDADGIKNRIKTIIQLR